MARLREAPVRRGRKAAALVLDVESLRRALKRPLRDSLRPGERFQARRVVPVAIGKQVCEELLSLRRFRLAAV